MIRKTFLTRAILFALISALALIPSNDRAMPAAALPVQAEIGVNGFYSADKAQRGRSVQAAVIVEIPNGYHIQANKLTNKFGIPTVLKVDAPNGFRISPIIYPRATIRKLGFSNEPMALYEGRAVMRFNVTVPANSQLGETELHARVKYQSCNNEVCFPPTTREVSMPIIVVNANESVKRINGNVFGGGRRR